MSSPFTRLMTEDEELMFDAGLMDGRDKERERIIKLLEASATAWSENCTKPIDWKHCQNCWQIASLIELIKGENK